MPPATAPTSVHVTSAAACAAQMQIGTDRGQHEAEHQQIEAVHRVAEHRSDERTQGMAARGSGCCDRGGRRRNGSHVGNPVAHALAGEGEPA